MNDRVPRRSEMGKAILALVVLGAAVLAVHLTPLRAALTQVRALSERLQAVGWAAPVVFMAGTAVLVAAGVPRLLLCPIGGMAFGFLYGLLWTQIGTVVGSYGTFLFVRWGGRDILRRRWPTLDRYSRLAGEQGILSVVLIKQVPLSAFAVNGLLALTMVSHGDYLIGTALGILPQAVPATMVGAGLAQVTLSHALALVMGAAVWLLAVWWAFRSRRGTAQGSGA